MNIEIANRLVKLRKAHNLSQEELANKLGISRQAVSKWERAEASPDTDNLITLAKLYNVSLDDLLYSDEDILDLKDKLNAERDRVLTEDVFFDQRKELPRKHISIDDDLISVTLSEDSNVHIIQKSNWDKFPYPVLMVIIFFILGFAWNLWEIAWLVFLTIPIYYSIGTAIRRKNLAAFAFPVLAAEFYLITGFLWGWWDVAWVVFLLVPIYYWVASLLKK